MKKKLLVGTTLVLSSIASTTVTACGTNNINDRQQLIELSQVLPNNTDIETIYLGNTNKPTVTNLKGAIRNWIRKLHKNKVTKILSEIEIPEANITTTSAVVKAKTDSKIYQGQVTVIFTIDQSIPLSQILPNNAHLGIIKTEGIALTPAIIKAQIKKKYLEIDEEKLYILQFNQNNAQVIGDAKTYLGQVNITYQFDQAVDLNTKLANNTNLGIFNTHGSNPTILEIKSWIIATIQTKYPTIKLDKIAISAVTNHNALISGISDTYQGKIHVFYTLDKTVALNEKIVNGTHLGTFWTHGKPFGTRIIKTWIMKKIHTKYPTINQDKIYILDKDIGDNHALISGISDTYQGQTTVNFTINHSIALREILPADYSTIYLGRDDKANETNIKNDLLKHNIDINAITVTNINANSATITGDGVNYAGVVTINFKTTNFTEISGITGAVTSLVVTSDGQIYAGTKTSDDTGAVFVKDKDEKEFKNIIPEITGAVTSLVKDQKDTIYIATNSHDGAGKVYRLLKTKLQDQAFDIVEMELPYNDIIVTSLITDKDDYVYGIAINKENTTGVFLKGLLGKNSFKHISNNSNYRNQKFNAIVAINRTGTIYLVGNYIMFEYNKDFPEDAIYLVRGGISANVLTTDLNDQIYAGGTQGVYHEERQEEDRKNFKLITGTEGEILALIINDNFNIFAGGKNGIVYRCVRLGAEFKPLTGTEGEILVLAKDHNGNIYVGTDTSKVYQY